ncbi:MAG TPA: hypothetical protein VFV30_09120 [Novosphingobium sp.]|nr:hypothetical protein [Novosphingobium sp.]
MKAIALPLLLLGTVQCAPSAQPQPHQGLWAGTVDGLEARLCFLSGNSDGLEMVKIHYAGDTDIHELTRQNRERVFRETDYNGDAVSTMWIGPDRAGRLTLYRHKGGKTSQAELQAVPVAEGGPGGCESAAFLAPRFPEGDRQTEPMEWDGHPYSRVTYRVEPGYSDVAMTGIALDGSKPGDAAINARLEVAATSWGPGDDYRSCANRNRSMRVGIAFAVELLALTDRYVSVRRDYSGSCGGSYDADISYWLLDRETGQKLDPESFLGPKAFKRGGNPNSGLTESLAKRIAVPFTASEDTCYFNPEIDVVPPIAVHKDGLGFYRGRGEQEGCTPVVVSWTEIAPYLTPAARRLLINAD